MAERKLGAAVVEVAARGVEKLKADLASVKGGLMAAKAAGTGLAKTDVAPGGLDKTAEKLGGADTPATAKVESKAEVNTADARQSLASLMDYAEEVKRDIGSTPASIALALDEQRKNLREQVAKELESLPKEKRVTFVTEKLEAAQKQLKTLQAELQKTPTNLVIKAKLDYAKGVTADLQNQLNAVKSPRLSMADMSGVFTRLGEQLGKLTPVLQQIGSTAQRTFAVGTASIIGMLKVADPARFAKLHGALLALAVNVGSIFIPVLQKAIDFIERLVVLFNNLSGEQKANILRWVGVAGAVVGVIALIPKLIALINFTTAAMGALGVSTGIATGGISVLIGAIAALGGSFIIMNASGEKSKGILNSLYALVQPFIDIVKSIIPTVQTVGATMIRNFALIANLFKPFFAKLVQGMGMVAASVSRLAVAFMPLFTLFTRLWRAALSIILPLVGMFIRFQQTLVDTFARILTAVMDALNPIIDVITDIVDDLADIFAETIEAIMPLIEELITGFKAIVPIIEWVAQMVADALRSMVPVIKQVLGTLTEMVKGVARSVVFTTALLKAIRSGNISGAYKEAEQAVKDFEERLAQRKKEREGEYNLKTDKGKEKKKPDFTPLGQQQVQLTGFAELWRKAQQSTVETPEQRAIRERLKQGKEMIEEQKKTNKLLSEKTNAIVLPGQGLAP